MVFFSWVDPPLCKKKVTFSKKNKIHIIENKEDHGWNLFNIHMNNSHYALIRDTFNKELNSFIKFNPFFKKKSNDDLILQICEFTENKNSNSKNASSEKNITETETETETETLSQINVS
jgi:hypothetical protein